MTSQEMLRELGYGSSHEEIKRFQRDHNAYKPGSLLLTGKLDDRTGAAVSGAYQSRVLFVALRDGKGW